MRRPGAQPPGGPADELGYRTLMLAASLRVASAGGQGSRAVRRALRAVAFGRCDESVQASVGRIDAYRTRLPADVVAAVPDPRGRPDEQRVREATEAVRWMSMPPVLGALSACLVRELRPRSCLELGTGFGLSAAYQAAALELNGAGRLITLDVDEMADVARAALARLGLADRVELVRGRIEETVPAAVERAAPVDLALLDADHTERGTVSAFDAVLPGLAPGAVVLVDDINWTEEMGRAWRAIRRHERVAAAVSVRRLGIAVLAPRQT